MPTGLTKVVRPYVRTYVPAYLGTYTVSGRLVYACVVETLLFAQGMLRAFSAALKQCCQEALTY